MLSRSNTLLFNAIALAVSAAFLAWVGITAVGKRSVPAPGANGATPLYRAETQRDAYGLARSVGLRGARIIQVNRFLNLVGHALRQETASTPFPIRAFDARSMYEMAIDSHNWLFVAGRTGAVRRVTVVLPGPVFREKAAELAAEGGFAASDQRVQGHIYEMPIDVFTLGSLPVVREPVVLAVDAGYFAYDADPLESARLLRGKCRDVRALILVESFDELDLTAAARDKLRLFGLAWSQTT